MHLERLQAVLGHQLSETAGNIRQAGLASGEEQTSRDSRRDAFDTVLQGVVQVSQGRHFVSLLVSTSSWFLTSLCRQASGK